MIQLCKAKLQRAVVTDANINYHGSITIDKEILNALNVFEFEKVLVVNFNNGNRFETYVIPGIWGKREICLNGGTAKLGSVGDEVGFLSFKLMSEEEAIEFRPKIVSINKNGDIIFEDEHVK